MAKTTAERIGALNNEVWGIANNGVGDRIWFVRKNDHSEYCNNKNGDLIRYTLVGALNKAEQLNKGK